MTKTSGRDRIPVAAGTCHDAQRCFLSVNSNCSNCIPKWPLISLLVWGFLIWLLPKFRISFKILLITYYKAPHGTAPSCIKDEMNPQSEVMWLGLSQIFTRLDFTFNIFPFHYDNISSYFSASLQKLPCLQIFINLRIDKFLDFQVSLWSKCWLHIIMARE